MRVKITKLREADNPYYPNHVEPGYERVGKFVDYPEVGKPFYVGMDFRTSKVQEVIDASTFRTMNSVYRYELI